jgi:hypothetical protein
VQLAKRYLFLLFLAVPAHATSNLISSMTWTESGDYKMPRQDQVPWINGAFCSSCTISRVWDGTTIRLFGAKGELLTWATYLVASSAGDASNVMVKLSSFTGTGLAAGSGFSAVVVSSANAWDYSGRPYSLYKYGYLQQVGMTKVGIGWDPSEYDEQQLPPRWQVPCTLQAAGYCTPNGGTYLFTSRQDKNKFYPDPAVPIEEFGISSFTVSASSSQAIGGEVYISTGLIANSTYTATLTVYEGGSVSTTIPVALYVYNVTLPPTAALPVVADLGVGDLGMRLTGTRFPASWTVDPYLTNTLRVGAFLHRHKVIPLGDPSVVGQNYPSVLWAKFLDGSAFREAYGSAYNTGPGYAVADSTYVIGLYGLWNTSSWSTSLTGGSNDFCTNASSWTAWCVNNNKKCFLYTIHDEAAAALDETLALHLATMTSCAFNGSTIPYTQTGDLRSVAANQPDIQTVWSTQWMNPSTATYQALQNTYLNSSTHSVGGYNTGIGADSNLTTQEEGLGPREVLWGAYKTKTPIWFLWEINYWSDSNNGGQTQNGWNANTNNDNDVYNITKTFGYDVYPSTDSIKGHSGFNWSSGNAVFLYPATDGVYANPNFGFNGVVGSWRLNMLTRGIQDVDIIKAAFAVNPSLTTTYVNAQVQDVMFLRQCYNPADCSYSYGSRPWNENLSSWETTRESLLQIAAGLTPTAPPVFTESMNGNINFTGKATCQ